MSRRVAALIPAFAGCLLAAGLPGPEHAVFDELLRRYVSKAGVDYAAWHASETDRRALRDYLEELERMRISRREEMPGGRDAALAYWINLYNAATLNLVLDGYPTDSIKDLGGIFSSPWKRDVVEVDGEKLSLDEIENDVIRSRFGDARIHFALNCAARGCPPLRAGAFVADSLDAQLEEQTRAFLEDPERNRIDADGTLHLSRIFDWYEDDFANEAGSVAAWVLPYLERPDGTVPGEEPRVEYLDYDWSLNDDSDGGESGS